MLSFFLSCLIDMALDMLKRCPSLAVTPDRHGSTFLQALASMPSAFPSGCASSRFGKDGSTEVSTMLIYPLNLLLALFAILSWCGYLFPHEPHN